MAQRKARTNRDHAHQKQRPDASDAVIAQRLEDLGHTGFVEQVEGMIRAKEEETARSGQEVDDFNRDMARIDVLLESLKARTKGLATPEEFQGALADYAAAGAKKK